MELIDINIVESYVKGNEGDIVEIGAGYGENTIQFLKLAEKYFRTVIVIDPFESGWDEMPQSYRYEFETFEGKVREYKHRLILHKKTSLCESSENMVSSPIAFAYVDGLQYKGAILNDLRIVSHAKVICVDDMDRQDHESQVPCAVNEFIKQTNRKLINTGRWAYII